MKPETTDQLHKLLPEIQEITHPKIREQTEQIFLNHCSDYFWIRPASSSGKYHPRDHCGDHGLLIHTKRAFTAYQRLSRSYLHANQINDYEQDCGRAAILLHDIYKYGKPPEHQEHTVSDHDRIAYRHLQKNTDLPDEVLGCIDSHNGPWGEGKEPETELEQLHHTADMIASDRNSYFKIQNPCSALQDVLQKPEHKR